MTTSERYEKYKAMLDAGKPLDAILETFEADIMQMLAEVESDFEDAYDEDRGGL